MVQNVRRLQGIIGGTKSKSQIRMLEMWPYGLPEQEGFFHCAAISTPLPNRRRRTPLSIKSSLGCARPSSSASRWLPVPRASWPGIWVCFGVTEKTARHFLLKAKEAMDSIESDPMDGTEHVDEFVFRGVENRKIGRATTLIKRRR